MNDLFGDPIPEPPAPKPKRRRFRPPPRVPGPCLFEMEMRPTHLCDMATGLYVGILEWDPAADQAAHDRLPSPVRDFLNYSAVQWDAQAVERGLEAVDGKHGFLLRHMEVLEELYVDAGSPRLTAFCEFKENGLAWADGG